MCVSVALSVCVLNLKKKYTFFLFFYVWIVEILIHDFNEISWCLKKNFFPNLMLSFEVRCDEQQQYQQHPTAIWFWFKYINITNGACILMQLCVICDAFKSQLTFGWYWWWRRRWERSIKHRFILVYIFNVFVFAMWMCCFFLLLLMVLGWPVSRVFSVKIRLSKCVCVCVRASYFSTNQNEIYSSVWMYL